jgi:hypothetical protein
MKGGKEEGREGREGRREGKEDEEQYLCRSTW